MGNRLIKVVILMLIFFPIHLYATGSIMALVKIVDETPFKSEQLGGPSPVRERTINWVTYWVKKPVEVMEVVISPRDDFQKDVQKRTLWATPIVYLIVFYMSLFKMWKKRKFDDASKYGSHGTSRWARTREIFRLGELTKMPVNEKNAPGVILGSLMGTLRRIYVTLPPDSEYNQNIILYGGSGIGKSYTWVKTQILHAIFPFAPIDAFVTKIKLYAVRALGPFGRTVADWFNWPISARAKEAKRRKIPKEYSLVVVDPKGENYADTAGILEKNGYMVWMINLIDLWLSAHWNPLDYVRDDLEAEKLAVTIISNSSLGHRGGGDPFWERAETALLAALILFVKYELPEDQQNVSNVLTIILTIGDDEDTLNGMFDNLSFNHPAKMKYKIFALSEDKTRTGILIGFSSHLQLWTNRYIQDLTVQSDFKLGDLGTKKMALFLVIPDADKTFKSVTSLFFAQCFQEWWKVARKHGDTLPVGVRLIMDEFANIGYIPDFAERMSVMRSKGVSAQIILQTRSQLDNLYKDTADIIAAACDTTVFLGTNDDKTAESMSKTLGDMTIKVQSTSSDPKKIFHAKENLSEQYQERKLMKPEEIKRNSRKLNIIIQNGAFPYKTKKTPYTKHPMYKDYEERIVEEYKAPPTRSYSLFDFETYLAENGVYQKIMVKEQAEQLKENNTPSTNSSGSVLTKIYKDDVSLTPEAVVQQIPIVPQNHTPTDPPTEPEQMVVPAMGQATENDDQNPRVTAQTAGIESVEDLTLIGDTEPILTGEGDPLPVESQIAAASAAPELSAEQAGMAALREMEEDAAFVTASTGTASVTASTGSIVNPETSVIDIEELDDEEENKRKEAEQVENFEKKKKSILDHLGY